MKYFRRVYEGQPEELTQSEFIQGIRGEFIFAEGYYEHLFMLIGHGDPQIGSKHMYWVEWKD